MVNHSFDFHRLKSEVNFNFHVIIWTEFNTAVEPRVTKKVNPRKDREES
jgi:hypothetical protein